MNKIGIYIDESLPSYKTLLCELEKSDYLTFVDDLSADIILRYAHGLNRDLKPLEDFLLRSNTKEHIKSLFFSWFDFYSPNQSLFFKNYQGLWAKSNFEILQLPYDFDKILELLKKEIQ